MGGELTVKIDRRSRGAAVFRRTSPEADRYFAASIVNNILFRYTISVAVFGAYLIYRASSQKRL